MSIVPNNIFMFFNGAVSQCRTFAVFFFIFAISPLAQGQDLESTQQFQEDLLRWSQEVGSLPANTRLIVFTPLKQIDPDLASSDMQNNLHATSALVDKVPLPQPLFSDSGQNVYSIYRLILNNREPETFALSNTEKCQLHRSEELLLKHRCWLTRIFIGDIEDRVPSEKLTIYQDYAAKRAKVATKLLGTGDDEARKALEEELAIIDSEWREEGYKEQVEKAIEQFKYIQERNPERVWSELEKKILSHSRIINGIRTPITTLEPKASTWREPAGWKTFIGDNTIAQIKIITISRPWLSLETIETRQWKWNKGTFNQEEVVVSDGLGFDTKLAGKELMPFVPVALILAKNISLKKGDTPISDIIIAGLISRVIPPLPKP